MAWDGYQICWDDRRLFECIFYLYIISNYYAWLQNYAILHKILVHWVIHTSIYWHISIYNIFFKVRLLISPQISRRKNFSIGIMSSLRGRILFLQNSNIHLKAWILSLAIILSHFSFKWQQFLTKLPSTYV